jgi:hypothetical protein
VGVASLVLLVSGCASLADEGKPVRSISVTGTAEVKTAPDQILWYIHLTDADKNLMEVNFNFESSRARDLRAETRLKALQAAKDKAEAMAKVVGAQLGPVLTINENQPTSIPWRKPLPGESRPARGAAWPSAQPIPARGLTLTTLLQYGFERPYQQRQVVLDDFPEDVEVNHVIRMNQTVACAYRRALGDLGVPRAEVIRDARGRFSDDLYQSHK